MTTTPSWSITSSRPPCRPDAEIYGCELDANLPKGFPHLGPEFRWLFIRNRNRFYNLLLKQGFEVVHHGKHVTIARRGVAVSARNSDFFRFCANTNPR